MLTSFPYQPESAQVHIASEHLTAVEDMLAREMRAMTLTGQAALVQSAMRAMYMSFLADRLRLEDPQRPVALRHQVAPLFLLGHHLGVLQRLVGLLSRHLVDHRSSREVAGLSIQAGVLRRLLEDLLLLAGHLLLVAHQSNQAVGVRSNQAEDLLVPCLVGRHLAVLEA